MRYAPSHKQKTRTRILDAAGVLFRKRGYGPVSVERVMHRAGLTVGGFYSHFSSKQRLLVETIHALLSVRKVRWLAGLPRGSPRAFRKGFVARYMALSEAQLPCPLPALVSELTRAPAPVRQALAEELGQLVDGVAEGLGGAHRRDAALRTVALSVGSLALAQATRGTELGAAFLRAAAGPAQLG